MTEKEFTELLFSDEKVSYGNYTKEVFDSIHYITDTERGVTILQYHKGLIVDCIRVNKDVYFYKDIYEAFAEWIKSLFHFEQFYFTGNILWVKPDWKEDMKYFIDVISLDINIKDKKLIIHELNIFSESKKTVIESPFRTEMKNLCQRVKEQTAYYLCPYLEKDVIEVYMPEVNQSLRFKEVKDIKVNMERHRAVVTFFEEGKKDFTIEF